MKSRTSFFNITVLRKDLTRFMWPWLIYCLLGVLNTLSYLESKPLVPLLISEELSRGVMTNAIFALVAVLCLFGDLFNKRLCNGLHALPVRREAWLVSHLVAAVIMWLLPQVIVGGIYIFVLGQQVSMVLCWLLGTLVQYLFFLSLATFCAMCVGGRFAASTLYTMLLNLGLIGSAVADVFFEPRLVGIMIPDEPFELFAPLNFFGNRELIRTEYVEGPLRNNYIGSYTYAGMGEGWWYVGVLGAVAVGLVVLAVLVYRRRRLECIGELVANAPVRAITWGVVSLLGGMIIYGLGLGIIDSVVILLAGVVLSGMLAYLFLYRGKKRIVKGAVRGGILAAVMGAAVLIVSLDPLGVTTWTPDVDEVESVQIGDYYAMPYSDYEGLTNNLVLTEPEVVRSVIALHDKLIEEGKQEGVIIDWLEYKEIYITYTLTDGTQKVRYYTYAVDSDLGRELEALWTSPEYLLGYEDWEELLDQGLTANVVSGRLGYEGVWLDEDETAELLQALKKDCQRGVVTQYDDTDIYIALSNGRIVYISNRCLATTAWLKDYMPELYEN